MSMEAEKSPDCYLQPGVRGESVCVIQSGSLRAENANGVKTREDEIFQLTQ